MFHIFKNPLDKLIPVIALFWLVGCSTLEPQVVQNEPNLSFTGVISAGEVSGERSKQLLGAVEANVLQSFPKAVWQTNKNSRSDVLLDIVVYSSRINDRSFAQDNRNCRRWSEPDKDAKGYLPRLFSRNCVDWQVQQTPCLNRKYELDVQIRVHQIRVERVIASERKVITNEQTKCGNDTLSTAALQAQAEIEAAAWAVNILKTPLGELSKKITSEQQARLQIPSVSFTALPEQDSLKDKQIEPSIQPISSAPLNLTGTLDKPIVPNLNTIAYRRALIIGNDSYKSVPKLANAREDARTIASNLTTVGYQVTLKLDLTEKEMKAALRAFYEQVQGGDEVLFFFAGHGVQLGPTNFLLPVDIAGDSEAQVRDEAIQLQRILDDMSERKAKFTLAIIDACRDNPFKSSGRAIGGRGLAPTTAATGQMVVFSAGAGQQALDKLNNADKNKNGLFTRVFVQEMQKPSQSIDRVIKNVRNQVAELAKSVGHEQVPAIYDQVLGDFYFKK